MRLLIAGAGLYGRVERCDGAFVATEFRHVFWLPLKPLGSVVVHPSTDNVAPEWTAVALSPRSVLAAYIRSWGLVVGTIAALMGVADVTARHDWPGAWPRLETAAVALVLIASSFVWWGRLGAPARAQRRVYAETAGFAVDVARLVIGRERLRDWLRERVVARAAGLASSGYRSARDPAREWPAILLDPSMTDPANLREALTLARLEWALAPRAARPERRRIHREIAARLRALSAA